MGRITYVWQQTLDRPPVLLYTVVLGTTRAHSPFGSVSKSATGMQQMACEPEDSGSLPRDLVMPGMTGVELHRAIAQQRPRLKVLFMSGYAEHPAIGQSPQAAGYPFLAKPFGPADLAAKVREVIDAEPAG